MLLHWFSCYAFVIVLDENHAVCHDSRLAGNKMQLVTYIWAVLYFPSEAHILEDVNKCVQALQDRDPETVDRTAGQIRGRTARLEDVVSAEMENYQQGPYTDNVMRAVLVMRNESKFTVRQDLKHQNALSSGHFISYGWWMIVRMLTPNLYCKWSNRCPLSPV